MTRTPQQVAAHHAEALGVADLDGIVSDFAEDAVMISPVGVRRGKEGIRGAFRQLIADLPDAAWHVRKQTFGGDVLLMEWAADAAKSRADDGVDTFVFRDGMIQAWVHHYAPIHVPDQALIGHPMQARALSTNAVEQAFLDTQRAGSIRTRKV